MTSRGRDGRFQTELKPIGDWIMDIMQDALSTPSADDEAGLIERIDAKLKPDEAQGFTHCCDSAPVTFADLRTLLAELSRLRAEIDEAQNVSLFDKACLQGEIRLTQAAVTRALAAEADNKRLLAELDDEKARHHDNRLVADHAYDRAEAAEADNKRLRGQIEELERELEAANDACMHLADYAALGGQHE